MSFKSRTQAIVSREESLRNNPDVGDNAHEIGVAVPARDDMAMEVIVDPGTGRLPQIYPDIESLGRCFFVKDGAAKTNGAEKIEHLLVRQ